MHTEEFALRARIVDLAVGGIRLHVDAAAPLPVGTHVRLDLRLDGLGAWLHLSGRLARVTAHVASREFVIELDGVPSSFEDLVQDELLAAIECAQKPHVLIVDADRGRRELVADAFRVTKFHVIETSSPLEAISKLDESRLHPWSVVIADTELGPCADELRRFLGEVYPGVSLIVIGARGLARSSTRLSVDGIPDLGRQIRRLVAWRDPAASP